MGRGSRWVLATGKWRVWVVGVAVAADVAGLAEEVMAEEGMVEEIVGPAAPDVAGLMAEVVAEERGKG